MTLRKWFLAVLASCFVSVCLSAEQSERNEAQKSFLQAKRLDFELHEPTSAPPSREKHLECIRAYQRVYQRDPHFSLSDDAVFEAAKLYQEMGETFSNLEYYRSAAKLFRFLLSQYSTSPRCSDALLRLGDMYADALDDKALARETYDQVRKRFKATEASLVAARKIEKLSQAPKPRPAPDPAVSAASVQSIRHWSTSNYTRVIIDLDKEAQYLKTRLANPDRIYFDIQSARLSQDLMNKTFLVGDAFLKQVRAGQNRLDVVRVVLDFANITNYSVFELHDPFRIIIDIHGSQKAPAKTTLAANPPPPKSKEPTEIKRTTPAPSATTRDSLAGSESQRADVPVQAAAKPERRALETKENGPSEAREAPASAAATDTPKPVVPVDVRLPMPDPANVPKMASPNSRGNRTLTRMLGLKIGRIVLDPGHGGHDTGTIGRNGLKEKDLVLQVARELQTLLEDKLGAEVVLTRKDDTFIALEERTAIANQSQADLFVSIHANSSGNRSVSGVETYYLNFAQSDEAREVAARENAATVRNIRDLQDLLKSIAQADKSSESRELASLIQRKLYGGTSQVFPTTRNRGVRSAPFVVLIGANMPSVLAEVGFISNPRDEKLLKKETNQQKLAQALFAGIEGYMKTLGINVARNNSN
jgi:N-acetylmuramoyl-L-alanine amidase